MRSSVVVLLFLFLFKLAFSQSICDKFSDKYIPVDLNEALLYLECNWNESDKESFSKMTEREASANYHFGTGMSIRNSWGLWNGDTEIVKYFHSLGIYHPDDISGIIITSFHRYLNKKELKLDDQVNYYKTYWKNLKKKKQEKELAGFNLFNISDTVDFLYSYGFISQQQENYYDNDSCFAKAILLEKDSIQLMLKVKLVESCDMNGIILFKSDTYEQVDGKMKLKEKDKTEIMKVGEVKWTEYQLWEEP
ncbi:MAG: hypothetical protein JEY96_19805 [Bacteroidales bacterium]|nr:hypothetical protein [Bacteroidales bacterium]MBI9056076.1 hypothetical protein [Bacteroidales bacterium]